MPRSIRESLESQLLSGLVLRDVDWVEGHDSSASVAPVCIAFRLRNGVSTRDMNLCGAQWLAYVLLCRRFAAALAGDSARLEVDVDRYSFIVSDSHRLLIAGLPQVRDNRYLRAQSLHERAGGYGASFWAPYRIRRAQRQALWDKPSRRQRVHVGSLPCLSSRSPVAMRQKYLHRGRST